MNPSRRRALSRLLAAALALGLVTAAEAQTYRSPQALAVAPDGKTLYAADRTAGCVVAIDLAAGKPVREIAVPGEPCGLAISGDGHKLYVAERRAHAVAVIDTAQGTVAARIGVGPWPVAVVLAEASGRLFTCNRGDHSVSAVELASGKELKRIAMVREPCAAALTPDGKKLVVANLLPAGAGTDKTLAAEVCIVDTGRLERTARVKLPPGASVASGVCVSPDGRFGYVVYSLGRFNMPITQLERGWVHTYALGILDLDASSHMASVLLDDIFAGAADPWGVIGSPDGRTLWISHAGTHEVSIVDVGKLHRLLRGELPPELAGLKDGIRENVWTRIKRDPAVMAELANDLTALHIAGAIRRVPSGGLGPRGLALAADGQRLFVANYFSGTVGVLDPAGVSPPGSIAVGPQPEANAARRGELYFHDARRCFQRWHSCASCHPDGRVDGLPWDFMRDGIGNGKDVISLVGIEGTSPHNRRGTRADPRECMRTGVIGSHLVVPEPADVDDLLAYVFSLQAEPNPAPPPAEASARGRALFEGKAGCAHCHPAPRFTDRKMHNVGLLSPLEPDGKYDTPSLVEVYRTAPYFHDGRAPTLRSALVDHDPEGRHGHLKELSPAEIDDLVAYLQTL